MAEWLREMSVGQWYQADAEPFEVVGVDARAEIVLVQHFDGTLGEIDFDSWAELNARPIPPPEDYSGAVFTLSNLGAFPIDRFTAIVPPGQSGILAIGRIRDEVVVRDGGFFAAKLMSLTLSADHRLVDGADGAALLARIKALLEEADQL